MITIVRFRKKFMSDYQKKLNIYINSYCIFHKLGDTMPDQLVRRVSELLKKMKEAGEKVTSKETLCKIILHEFVAAFRMTPLESNLKDIIPSFLLQKEKYVRVDYTAPTFLQDKVSVQIISENEIVAFQFKDAKIDGPVWKEIKFGLNEVHRFFCKTNGHVRFRFSKFEEWRKVLWDFLKPKEFSSRPSTGTSTPDKKWLDDLVQGDWDDLDDNVQ